LKGMEFQFGRRWRGGRLIPSIKRGRINLLIKQMEDAKGDLDLQTEAGRALPLCREGGRGGRAMQVGGGKKDGVRSNTPNLTKGKRL